jgi:hypothetical protein
MPPIRSDSTQNPRPCEEIPMIPDEHTSTQAHVDGGPQCPVRDDIIRDIGAGLLRDARHERREFSGLPLIVRNGQF